MQNTSTKLIDFSLILEKSGLSENMKIADLGCGSSGHFTFKSSKLLGKGGLVYAVDILKPLVVAIEKKAREENINNIKSVWSDIEIFGATKIESSSLDIVFLINTMYQSKKREEILREAKRLMKNNAKLVIVDWNKESTTMGPPMDIRVGENELIKLAEKQNISFSEEFRAGQNHFGIILKNK